MKKINKYDKKIKNPYIFFLMGPTGIGKTNVALSIGEKIPIEIINIDSSMIYRDMNIGTNKPSLEQQAKVKHNLLDFICPSYSYSAGNFLLDINLCIHNIIRKKKIPILVGGSILHFQIIYNGLVSLPGKNHILRNRVLQISNSFSKNTIERFLKKINNYSINSEILNNNRRIERLLEIYFLTRKFFYAQNNFLVHRNSYNPMYNIIPISINIHDRFFSNKNIRIRFLRMLEKGFIKEVEILLNKYNLNKNSISIKSIGYKQVYEYINQSKKKNSYRKMVNDVTVCTRKLVKKQLTLIKKWNNLIKLDLEKRKKNDILSTIIQYLK